MNANQTDAIRKAIVEARRAADEACGAPAESAIGYLIDAVRALADANEALLRAAKA